MNALSSRATFVHKRLLPIFWFGFIVVFVVMGVAQNDERQAFGLFVGPAVMAVFGFLFFRRLVWPLADEVLDGGDYLIVRKGGLEQRVPLANIMNVSGSMYINPPRVTLRLVEAGPLGDEVAFMPRRSFNLNPFARNKVVDDLMVRAYEARTRSAR
ncbi:MAG TPA: hypothetical protein VMB76_13250 [Casimicrobiaceae bacterium]|jgi:hypothetical protein|nr:hypothetical protein [Casimicrobiaceae bacterium]